MYFFPEFGIIDKIDIDSFTQSERCVIAINFEGLKCGICEKEFEKDEDVVVCPECGTPMHRSCYKETGVCPAADKHSDGFVFDGFDKIKESAQQLSSNAINKKKQTKKEVSEESEYPCHLCGEMNKPNANFCNRCGTRLIKPDKKPAVSSTEELSDMLGVEVKQISPVQSALDPLAGIPASAQFEEDVTAADMACYIAVNTPYYMRAFDLIKRKANKFNWSAAVFSGIWFLYRKQYKAGALIFSIETLLYVMRYYFSVTYSAKILESLLNNMGLKLENIQTFSMEQYVQISSELQKLPVLQQLLAMLPSLLFIIQIAAMIVIGFWGNKLYYKHCVEKITSIKHNAEDESLSKAETAELINAMGGVNVFLAGALLFIHIFMIMN